MPDQLYVLDSVQKVINAGFTIQQLKVENPTPFYIYINLTSQYPTNIDNTYMVAPNTVFVSPSFTSTTIAIVCSGVNVSKGVAKVTVYSEAKQQSSSLPFQTAQFVGNYPNYPHTPSSIAIGTALPDVTISRFQTVYFIMKGTPNLGLGNVYRPTLLGILYGSNGSMGIGSFNVLGGVIPYIPTAIPQTITPIVYNTGTDYPRSFDVIQTPDPIEVNYGSVLSQGGANGSGGSYSEIFPAAPLGTIFSLYITGNQVAPFNGSLDITIAYSPILDLVNFATIYQTTVNFTGLSINNEIQAIKGKVFLFSMLGYMRVTVVNNAANQVIFNMDNAVIG